MNDLINYSDLRLKDVILPNMIVLVIKYYSIKPIKLYIVLNINLIAVFY